MQQPPKAGFIRPANPNPRAMRRSHVVVQRACHWGFKSLRPAPPMSSPDLIALRDVSGPNRVGRVYGRGTSMGGAYSAALLIVSILFRET